MSTFDGELVKEAQQEIDVMDAARREVGVICTRRGDVNEPIKREMAAKRRVEDKVFTFLRALLRTVDRLTAQLAESREENWARGGQTRHWALEADRLTTALKVAREALGTIKYMATPDDKELMKGKENTVHWLARSALEATAALAPHTTDKPWFKCSTPTRERNARRVMRVYPSLAMGDAATGWRYQRWHRRLAMAQTPVMS